MILKTKKDILEVLGMPEEEFYKEVAPLAKMAREEQFGNALRVTSMLGYTNICKNMCLYCGMRAGNSCLERFRIEPDKVIEMGLDAADHGFGRIFLIAGEDPKYSFSELVRIIRTLKERGMYVSLACGEFEKSQYEELASVGADEYVMKFEMSHADSFNRLNPSTNFEKRMKAVMNIKELGLKLASGNIVDWPGQSVDELADDIMLMKELDISWAPIIPYMPAIGTPLAAEKKRGSLLAIYKEIAVLRLMMPGVNITAQQPGEDLRKGLSDPEANIASINVGANVLFFDLLPDPLSQNFRVIDDRNISGTSHLYKIEKMGGFTLDTGKELVL